MIVTNWDVELVYVTDIETTPEWLWSALTESRFVEQYWSGWLLEAT